MTTVGGAAAVGVVSFGSTVAEDTGPTHDPIRIVDAVEALAADGSTKMHRGIQAALDMLGIAGGLVVLLTDGCPNSTEKATAAARAAGPRTRIVTVGIHEADQDFLKYHVASTPEDHFPVDRLDQLVATYQQIARLYVH